jgi:gas vesicle protein
MNKLFVGAIAGIVTVLLFTPQTREKLGRFSKDDLTSSEMRQWEGNTCTRGGREARTMGQQRRASRAMYVKRFTLSNLQPRKLQRR